MKRYNSDALRKMEKKPKKTWVQSNITMIRVVLMNPQVISFYAYKAWKAEIVGYTRPLTKLIEEDDESVSHLKIKFVGNRKVVGTKNTPLLTKGNWNWVMYLRPITDEDMGDVIGLARKWGHDVVDFFNDFIVPKHYDRPEVFQLDSICTNESSILNISDYLVQRSVIHYVKEFFNKLINDGSFFEESDLLDTFFPGVKDVRAFITYN